MLTPEVLTPGRGLIKRCDERPAQAVAHGSPGVSQGVYSDAYNVCTTGCPASTTDHQTIDYNTINGAIFWDASASYKSTAGNEREVQLFANICNLLNTDPEPGRATRQRRRLVSASHQGVPLRDVGSGLMSGRALPYVTLGRAGRLGQPLPGRPREPVAEWNKYAQEMTRRALEAKAAAMAKTSRRSSTPVAGCMKPASLATRSL